MKSLSTKLLAITCIFALATGCASVTDAGLDQQEPQVQQVTPPNADQGFGTDNDNSMDPIRDEPILD
ncbi:MAG: hypothetical protein U5J95_07155 [Balneolaceae bacterium]|nr:hypothetical protein [Balneolaceae bacterium]